VSLATLEKRAFYRTEQPKAVREIAKAGRLTDLFVNGLYFYSSE
jgi:hypothetical protein